MHSSAPACFFFLSNPSLVDFVYYEKYGWNKSSDFSGRGAGHIHGVAWCNLRKVSEMMAQENSEDGSDSSGSDDDSDSELFKKSAEHSNDPCVKNRSLNDTKDPCENNRSLDDTKDPCEKNRSLNDTKDPCEKNLL